MAGESKPLYDEDFVRWTEQQAAALRAAAGLPINAPLDWENLAEEVESLGNSQRRELGSRLRTIIEHLLKLQVSAASYPRGGCKATIVRERGEVETLLKQSPSLRNDIPEMIADGVRRGRRVVELELARRREGSRPLAELSYGEDEVLGDWLPD